MSEADRPLTKRLKEDNWDLHQIAEHAEDGPSRLIDGSMPKDEYVAMLEQELLCHRVLDEAVRVARESHAAVKRLVPEDQFRTAYIEEDLRYFGVEPAGVEAKPGTTRFIEHVERVKNDPMAVLGLHYVRTGAANGNRYVAKKVRKTFGLPETGEGTRHLDPWGEAQRKKWEAFKHDLDVVGLSAEEQDRVFKSVREMYVYAINMNSQRHVPAEELLAMHGDKLDKKQFDESHRVPAGHG